jgi:energy-coupling factor transport system permease protein
MEARAYNPRYTRTRYRNYAINWYDWILFCGLSVLFGLFIYATAKKFLFEPFSWPEAILQYGG